MLIDGYRRLCSIHTETPRLKGESKTKQYFLLSYYQNKEQQTLPDWCSTTTWHVDTKIWRYFLSQILDVSNEHDENGFNSFSYLGPGQNAVIILIFTSLARSFFISLQSINVLLIKSIFPLFVHRKPAACPLSTSSGRRGPLPHPSPPDRAPAVSNSVVRLYIELTWWYHGLRRPWLKYVK